MTMCSVPLMITGILDLLSPDGVDYDKSNAVFIYTSEGMNISIIGNNLYMNPNGSMIVYDFDGKYFITTNIIRAVSYDMFTPININLTKQICISSTSIMNISTTYDTEIVSDDFLGLSSNKGADINININITIYSTNILTIHTTGIDSFLIFSEGAYINILDENSNINTVIHGAMFIGKCNSIKIDKNKYINFNSICMNIHSL